MENEKRFFSQVDDALHSYEEDYVPGAWEEFCKERKRRRALLFWRFSGAAAVLLLFSLVAIQLLMKAPMPDKLQLKTKTSLKNNPLQTKDTAENKSKMMTMNNAAKHYLRSNTGKAKIVYQKPISQTVSAKSAYHTVVANNDSSGLHSNGSQAYATNNNGLLHQMTAPDTGLSKPAAKAPYKEEPPKTAIKKYIAVTKPVYDSLVNRLKPGISKKSTKNLSYAFMLSPGVGNQKLNFGTGLEVSYKIADNFFLNSGVSYSSLHAATNGDNSGGPSHQFQGANLDVSGFEVPLGLLYKTKGGFYASAGILGMTVISNRLEYNYLVPQVTAADLSLNSAGIAQQGYTIVTQKQTELSQEKINNYLGFYQFSVGQKTTIGHNEFNFGPFIKIPFGPVSSENIKLLQGGVRISIGF